MSSGVPLDDDADTVTASASLHDDEIADTIPQMTQPTLPATLPQALTSDPSPSLPAHNGGHRSKFKVVFLGDAAVGKTSIVTRFVYDQFDGAYKVTIGIDFVSKTVSVPDSDTVVRLQLWDTAGQERFRSLIPSYIRDSHVAVIVFDLTSRPSYESAFVWLNDVRTERGDDVVCYLVGNKCDTAAASRTVSSSEAAAKCTAMAVEFMETSALSGQNVARLFQDIARRISDMTTRRADAYMGMQSQPTEVSLTAQSDRASASAYCGVGC